MKKILLSIILACACMLTVFAFTGCGNGEGVSEPTSQTTALNTIAFGEKYKYTYKQNYSDYDADYYLVMYSDGTAVSTYYCKTSPTGIPDIDISDKDELLIALI